MAITKEAIRLIEQDLAERFADDISYQLRCLAEEGNTEEAYGLTEDDFDDLRSRWEGAETTLKLFFSEEV